MGPGNLTAKNFSFNFVHDKDLKLTVLVVIMLLIWGVGYMSIINHRLFFFFNETVFNSLLGVLLGFFVGGSEQMKQLGGFFLPWKNFENNILPFMIIYPGSKLCAEAARKQFKMSFSYAILCGTCCVVLDTCAFVAYLSTRPPSFYYPEAQRGIGFQQVMFAMFMSASVSLYDSYLCVHNFPEIRGNSLIRGFLSGQGIIAMSFALELREFAYLLASEPSYAVAPIFLLSLKRLVLIPLVSILLGISAGLFSSYITKHSSFLHLSQEMVVLPCTNYIAYTLAQKMGLSAIITSVSCEVTQGTYSINNISEASKIAYKAVLAKSSKLLGFFCTLSLGFHFGSSENICGLWRLVSAQMFATFLCVTVVVRIFSSLMGYWCVQRLGFQMRRSLLFLHVLIHTRATPSLMSLIDIENHAEVFRVCPQRVRSIQWTLYLMCCFVNIINVPLVGLLYTRLKIEPDIADTQAEPIFRVIFKLMYQEMHKQIVYLSGERRSYEYVNLALNHIRDSFVRYVMSLGFMSVPERKCLILSAYDESVSQRSNVIDKRRKSVRSKNRIFATQACASFIVRNLGFEGFHAEDIAEYFMGQ